MANATDRVAVFTAMSKAVKAKNDEARAELEEELREAFDAEGFEKKQLRVNGQKVGEAILPKKAAHLAITDREAFEDFALCNGLAEIRYSIEPAMEERAAMILKEHLSPEEYEQFVYEDVMEVFDWEGAIEMVGAIPTLGGVPVPGVSYIPEARGSMRITGCDPVAVLPLVHEIGGVDQLLLEAGDE